jgi:formylglycine-generating enzyme required for sulfatase activity
LELDAGDRRSLLEPVALWMMEQRLREIELDDLRRQLAGPFKAMLKDWRQTEKAVNGFVHLINARSGLLTERGQGIYAFSHLTFQEHLAARAVADRDDYIEYTLARVGDSWWREVVLLEAGYLSTQGKRRATELIRAIMEHPQEPEPYHNLVLAAEAVRDVGQARTEGDLAGEIQSRLRRVFETPLRKGDDLPALIQRRAAAAEALGKIESEGFGAQPAFWTLPWGIPVWVEIPAGAFWMGGEQYDDEQPVHQVHLERYWISRVPITNAQYRFFVEETGREPPRHWEDGRVPRDKESHPVVYVTWHDALAYCRWLEEKWRGVGSKLRVWTSTGIEEENLDLSSFNLQLPSEAEWEKAARGAADRREYPWGEAWREGHCNTDELGVNDTTPVGIFPEGTSPYGALEMAGNVWEWTRSLWGPWDGESISSAKLQFGYPYDREDGRENLDADDKWLRVMRGGSCFLDRDFARCAFRLWYPPSDRSYFDGFRVVVSPLRP